MQVCRVDDAKSSSFRRTLKKLRKKYPKAADDVAAALAEIAKDHVTACNAAALPGYHGLLWKYRCRSSDMKRGQSGAFRIIAYFDEQDRVLYPMLIYWKGDRQGLPDSELQAAMAEVRKDLDGERAQGAGA